MNTLEIEIPEAQISINKLIPSEWNELSLSEIELCATKRLANSSSPKDLIELLICFLGYDASNKSEYKEMCTLMDYLLDDEDGMISDLYNLVYWVYTKDLIIDKPIYHMNLIHFQIHEGFQNVIVEHYFFIEHLYYEYRTNPTKINLCNLLGCIYQDYSFSKNDVDEYADKFSKVDSKVRNALLLNFIGLRNSFVRDYKSLFPKSKESKESEVDTTPDFYQSLQDLIFSLPFEKFGYAEKILETRIPLVFMYMEKLKKDSNKNPH